MGVALLLLAVIIEMQFAKIRLLPGPLCFGGIFLPSLPCFCFSFVASLVQLFLLFFFPFLLFPYSSFFLVSCLSSSLSSFLFFFQHSAVS